MVTMIKNYVIKEINSLSEAQMYWEKLSFKENIYEDWNFRYLFHKYYSFPINFQVCFFDNKPVALLPLQFNTQNQCLEFFGGDYMEKNKVFFAPGFEDTVPLLFQSLKKKAHLKNISKQDDQTPNLQFIDNTYCTSLKGLNTLEDFINRNFHSKSRNNLLKKIRKIKTFNPIIKYNQLDDLDLLIEFNKQEFQKESSFYVPYRSEIFHDLVKLPYNIQMMTVYINDKKEASSLSIKFLDDFVYFNAGFNKEAFSNLGTYLVIKNFELAIKLKCHHFDAGFENYGWKERFHLEKIPQYLYSNAP
jgi:hypothetical protein